RVAVIVTGVEEPTARWVTENVAVVWPARTVTLTGTVAADVSLLARVTTVPPVGAATERVTVPVTVVPSPPVTVDGLTETALSDTAAGSTVNVVASLAQPSVAVIVTGVEAPTARWVTVKVLVVSPAATVTLAGTVAADVALLVRVTTVPPVGAAAVSV